MHPEWKKDNKQCLLVMVNKENNYQEHMGHTE